MRPAEGSVEEFHLAVATYKKVRYLMAEGFTEAEAMDRVAADLDH